MCSKVFFFIIIVIFATYDMYMHEHCFYIYVINIEQCTKKKQDLKNKTNHLVCFVCCLLYKKDLADIHGRRCKHGVEAFPGWHRAYLKDFEIAIQVFFFLKFFV